MHKLRAILITTEPPQPHHLESEWLSKKNPVKEEHGVPMAQMVGTLDQLWNPTGASRPPFGVPSKAEQITDTLEWFPHHVEMPKTSNAEIVIAATHDFLKALKNPSKNSPIPALCLTRNGSSYKTSLNFCTAKLPNQNQQQQSNRPPFNPLLHL